MKEPRLHYYNMGEGVTAFSSTRQGGYSEGRYGEFNINHYCGDNEEAIKRNREALCGLLGIADNRLLMPHQVHGTEIAVVDEALLKLLAEECPDCNARGRSLTSQAAKPNCPLPLEGVDALMTDVAGVCIGVSTADCIPVLLYDKVHRAACTIHAGWRGTVQRIVEKAVAKMTAIYGSRPCDLAAQIGPGISLDSFEVGDEVYEAFVHEGFPMQLINKRYEKWHIDLPECNRLQLLSSGVPADHIAVSPICTFKQSDTFFSARRLGINSGRIFTGVLQ